MSGGIMNVGVRALVSNQIALQTIGNNIANVNTPGYSRQSAILQTVQGQASGSGFVGKGVDVQTILRTYDDFLTKQSALANSNVSADNAKSDYLQRLQEIFQTGENGLGATVGNFFNAFGDVCLAPSDSTARAVVMTKADQMAQQFNTNANSLNDIRLGVTDQLSNNIATANELIDQIANCNNLIGQSSTSGQIPNDLLDQRDYLIHRLNKYIQTSQVKGDNGSINLFISNSQPVVLGASSATLGMDNDEFNNTYKSKLTYSFGSLSGTLMDEAYLGGGEITGLLIFQNKDLTDATNMLGRMALAIGTKLNEQQALGADLNGNAGAELFSIASIPDALSCDKNEGSANISVSVQKAPSGTTSFKPTDYELKYDGSVWTATRVLDGTVVNLSERGFPEESINLDGLIITLNIDNASAGDAYYIRPFASAASSITAAFVDPQGLAIASPVSAVASSNNKGTLTLSSITALSGAGTHPSKTEEPPVITFKNSGSSYTYEIYRGESLVSEGVYTPSDPINYSEDSSSWTISLKGIPQDGDSFTIQSNSNFSLDSGNAQAILDLRDLNMFDGLRPLTDGYAMLVASIGVKVQSAKSSQQISTDIASSFDKQKSTVSGVNLDEEAARMIQYQQAYQAAGKMMQIAQSIFDTLLQGLGR